MLTPYICRRMSDEWDTVDSPSRVSPQQQNSRNVDERAKAVVSDRSLQDDDEVASDGSDARSESDADLKPGEQSRNDQVLKILNSNVVDPYIIWDNSTRLVNISSCKYNFGDFRAELLDFVDKHRNTNENTVGGLF